MQIDKQTPRGPFDAARRCRRERKIVVVADDGAGIALVLLDPGQSTVAGARFDHRGRTWEIRGPRADSGVLVAEPVASGGGDRHDY
ncbi:MAG: hypothetical protein PVG53_08175 [Holophagae bacterium]|jgi:hypothetical protein